MDESVTREKSGAKQKTHRFFRKDHSKTGAAYSLISLGKSENAQSHIKEAI